MAVFGIWNLFFILTNMLNLRQSFQLWIVVTNKEQRALKRDTAPLPWSKYSFVVIRSTWVDINKVIAESSEVNRRWIYELLLGLWICWVKLLCSVSFIWQVPQVNQVRDVLALYPSLCLSYGLPRNKLPITMWLSYMYEKLLHNDLSAIGLFRSIRGNHLTPRKTSAIALFSYKL